MANRVERKQLMACFSESLHHLEIQLNKIVAVEQSICELFYMLVHKYIALRVYYMNMSLGRQSENLNHIYKINLV